MNRIGRIKEEKAFNFRFGLIYMVLFVNRHLTALQKYGCGFIFRCLMNINEEFYFNRILNTFISLIHKLCGMFLSRQVPYS